MTSPLKIGDELLMRAAGALNLEECNHDPELSRLMAHHIPEHIRNMKRYLKHILPELRASILEAQWQPIETFPIKTKEDHDRFEDEDRYSEMEVLFLTEHGFNTLGQAAFENGERVFYGIVDGCIATYLKDGEKVWWKIKPTHWAPVPDASRIRSLKGQGQ